MTQERIDSIETPDGNVHTSTTIITEEPRRGISGWFVMFIVLAAVVIALWAFTATDKSEIAKDNAIENAANQMGVAADQIGDAASEVGGAAQSLGESAQDAATDAGTAVEQAVEPAATE